MMIDQGHGETMQYIVDMISQLATSTTSDCGTVATLTASNAKLAIQLDTSQAYIKTFNKAIVALKANIKLT
jgi:ribose 5-phosphate isomerase